MADAASLPLEKCVLRVSVGSSNPSKIRAVQQALDTALQSKSSWVQLEIQGFDVASSVADQPFADTETQTGAKNRAKAAYRAYADKEKRCPHLAIGMEGGLEWISCASTNGTTNQDELFCMAWMAIYGRRTGHVIDLFASPDTECYVGDKKPVFGLAKTANFVLPKEITRLVRQGVELGDADDRIFKRIKSKHGSGTVGILTNGLIDRSAYYSHSLILALTPWLHPNLYPHGHH